MFTGENSTSDRIFFPEESMHGVSVAEKEVSRFIYGICSQLCQNIMENMIRKKAKIYRICIPHKASMFVLQTKNKYVKRLILNVSSFLRNPLF